MGWIGAYCTTRGAGWGKGGGRRRSADIGALRGAFALYAVAGSLNMTIRTRLDVSSERSCDCKTNHINCPTAKELGSVNSSLACGFANAIP